MAEGKRSYVVDENGNRTAVMLPIEEYEELLEDLQDLAVIAQRRDEPTVPLDVVVEQLKVTTRRPAGTTPRRGGRGSRPVWLRCRSTKSLC